MQRITARAGQGSSADPRVLLVLTPWAAPYFPGLSVALLRSILERDGIACDLFYSNLLFSRLIGGEHIFEERIARGSLAELAFTPYYFGTSPDEAARTLHEHFEPFGVTPAGEGVSFYRGLLDSARRWVDEAHAAVEWGRYDVVGFSLMFQQTLASLALARRVKRSHPDIRVIFGGPSCAEPMGGEMMRSFPEVDFVVTGEGDGVIAPLVRWIRSGAEGSCELPGVLWRSGGGVARGEGPSAFQAMDSLPIPDYGPYFEQVREHGLDHFHPTLYVENSRGCWWGQKHHCTFCGIDDLVMQYRSKSVDRIVEEITTLSRRHRITSFLTADNILDHRAYRELLPRLRALREEEEFDFTFFFELKANLRREQVRLLREAGVAQVQPGIESFSDRVLGLMDKGCTGISQVLALRLFAEFDIEPVWNLIYMNPGERPEDYRQMAAMIPFLHHIPPLNRQNQVQMLLQRFNLYFENQERFGIRNVRPQSFYRLIFPDERIDLDELAYFFECEHSCHGDDELQEGYDLLSSALDRWRSVHRHDSLLQFPGPGFVLVRDRRLPVDGFELPEPEIVLRGVAADVLVRCDRIRSQEKLLRELAERFPVGEVSAAVDDLVSRRFLYRSPTDQLVSLPLRKEPLNPRLGSAYDGEAEAA